MMLNMTLSKPAFSPGRKIIIYMDRKSLILKSGITKGKFSEEYINTLVKKYNTGQAKEHAHRPALELYFENITGLNVVNDPKRSEFGAPDFNFFKGKIPLAYAEAKDIGVSLNDVEKGEQLERYYGYSNLILTDYLEFRFFRYGQKYGEPIKIAELKNGEIAPLEQNFTLAEDTIAQFIQEAKEPIKSGLLLAKVMAGKARRIRDNIRVFLKTGDAKKNEGLLAVYRAIKRKLLAELDYDKFADLYAQTVVYGLFVARYYDDTPDTFSRGEARDMVPASNPFLQEFFNHIAGTSFDNRIKFIVDELCEEFIHADIQAIVHNYYKVEKDSSRDPIIHFYEDFLKEYDPAERKSMGVFYTPLPVVNFIVRSIDEILKKDFGLKGLADSSKIEIPWVSQNNKSRQKVHKVQILDPATGTGTFLSAVISLIKSKFTGQEGRWSSYVKDDLLPRLHGFEIMMAPYTIAHLKLSTLLKESGANIDNERLGIYLTNSLEKDDKYDDTLFAGLGFDKAITEESRLAGQIKNKLPIMVVLGNPPYSGVSSNETESANKLVEKYKIEPGGKQKLQERKHWLNDDYVKFIAFAEDMIIKNGEGIVGFITNHGYLDNPTFRGMRWHLMDTFDSIYVIDLHGNAKKKEVSPDGSKDENIFDIQTGVSIMLAAKTGKKKKGILAKVYHFGIWGKRDDKFNQLNSSSLKNIKWTLLEQHNSNLFFVPEGSSMLEEEYQKGFSINEFFIESTTGIFTLGDGFIIDMDKTVLENRLHDFFVSNTNEASLKEKYKLGKNYAKWIIGNKKDITFEHNKIVPITYRPFDLRYTYFDNKLVWRPRTKLMSNFLNGSNMGLAVGRQGQVVGSMEWNVVFVTKNVIDLNCFYRGGEQVFPLYLYDENGSKTSNLNQEIYNKIISCIKAKVEPENILDYIYAVLHSPSYREKYKEFLKIDFPRVPYPKNEKQFFALAKLGEELRHLHLLESPKVNKFITTYPVAGDDVVEKVKFEDGKVFINKTQYFGGVPEAVWNFYIGGYQPSQKWLKDRKGRTLINEDIEHYQQMIVAMAETIRIMGEIDKIIKK
jgi:hypothetical protein